jgi:2-polyprenyl-6-methoxyphenol hydroxylase-like FAD-dependent oxidoreductase
VGAGPTGLVLAADLLARGIATRIIDKGNGANLETRAIAIHARALEVLDLMGVADRFIDHGHPVRWFTFYADGKRRVRLDLARNGSRFGFMLDIPQHETEALLRARVADLGGVIEHGAELIGLASDAGGVAATVRYPAGRTHVISAEYLVGCDGAHSRVRHELGLPFHGHPYPEDWLLADVCLDWSRPAEEVHAFFRGRGGPLVAFPMREHRWRLVLPLAGERDAEAPDLAEIQRLVDERAPELIVASDPTWLASFRCHRRSTYVYRQGRVLLAGDAVHIHSPAGGQGMNTGITDAHNLGWKLALVAARTAPEALLDSYGREREPVAERVLSLTHTLVRLGTMTNPAQRALRNTVFSAALRAGPIHRRAVRRWTQVSVTYPAGDLIRPGRGHGTLKAGQRAPDVKVQAADGPSTLFAVLRGGRHVLIMAGGDALTSPASPALDAYGDLVEVVTSAPEQARVPSGAVPVCLVRPDGHVAVQTRLKTLGPVLEYLADLRGATPAAAVR